MKNLGKTKTLLLLSIAILFIIHSRKISENSNKSEYFFWIYFLYIFKYEKIKCISSSTEQRGRFYLFIWKRKLIFRILPEENGIFKQDIFRIYNSVSLKSWNKCLLYARKSRLHCWIKFCSTNAYCIYSVL